MTAQRRVWAAIMLRTLVIFLSLGSICAQPNHETKPFRYVVRTGDSTSRLSARWGLPQSLISKPGRVLKVGEIISIPLAARTRVQRGGSLSALSTQYAVSVETLAKFNRVPPPYRVRAGKVIMVPALK
jgi:LysM repeat protein